MCWSCTEACTGITVSAVIDFMMRNICCIRKAFRSAAGGTIKPDVVLYEEGLDNRTLTRAVEYISRADVLIIGGTSLAVYPAAGLIDYYEGNKLVLVNKTPTSRDAQADLVVQGSIGEIFSRL